MKLRVILVPLIGGDLATFSRRSRTNPAEVAISANQTYVKYLDKVNKYTQ